MGAAAAGPRLRTSTSARPYGAWSRSTPACRPEPGPSPWTPRDLQLAVPAWPSALRLGRPGRLCLAGAPAGRGPRPWPAWPWRRPPPPATSSACHPADRRPAVAWVLAVAGTAAVAACAPLATFDRRWRRPRLAPVAAGRDRHRHLGDGPRHRGRPGLCSGRDRPMTLLGWPSPLAGGPPAAAGLRGGRVGGRWRPCSSGRSPPAEPPAPARWWAAWPASACSPWSRSRAGSTRAAAARSTGSSGRLRAGLGGAGRPAGAGRDGQQGGGPGRGRRADAAPGRDRAGLAVAAAAAVARRSSPSRRSAP